MFQYVKLVCLLGGKKIKNKKIKKLQFRQSRRDNQMSIYRCIQYVNSIMVKINYEINLHSN